MKKEEKLKGEERRRLLIQWLKEASEPISGSELASKTNVSRQVIVQDMSLLKASGEAVMATAQGYILVQKERSNPFSRVIVSNHKPDQTMDELYTIVDFGVTIEDVTVEHPVYGDIKASLLLSNRHDVDEFMNRLKETNAILLSELTEGIHLHTLSASSKDMLDKACEALNEKGYLL